MKNILVLFFLLISFNTFSQEGILGEQCPPEQKGNFYLQYVQDTTYYTHENSDGSVQVIWEECHIDSTIILIDTIINQICTNSLGQSRTTYVDILRNYNATFFDTTYVEGLDTIKISCDTFSLAGSLFIDCDTTRNSPAVEDKIIPYIFADGTPGILYIDNDGNTHDSIRFQKILCYSDLALTKIQTTVEPYALNDLVCYEIIIENLGGDIEYNTFVTDILDDCLTYATSSFSVNSVGELPIYDRNTGIALIGQLNPGDQITASICGTVECLPIWNGGMVQGVNIDTFLNNNYDTVLIDFPLADLSITKEFNTTTTPDSLTLDCPGASPPGPSCTVNRTTTFTLEACNVGTTDVVGQSYVTDFIPSGLTNINVLGGCTYNQFSNVWVVPPLNAGDCVQCEVEVTQVEGFGNQINYVQIENPFILDTDPSNNFNSDTLYTLVICDAADLVGYPIPYADVTIAQCSGGVFFGGSILGATGTCPEGFELEYQIQDGTWTTEVPLYPEPQDSIFSINTRCNCESFGIASDTMTVKVAPEPSCTVTQHLSFIGASAYVYNLVAGQKLEMVDLNTNQVVYTWAEGAPYENSSTLDNGTAIPISAGEYAFIEYLPNGCFCTYYYTQEPYDICNKKAYFSFAGDTADDATYTCWQVPISEFGTELQYNFSTYTIEDAFTVEYPVGNQIFDSGLITGINNSGIIPYTYSAGNDVANVCFYGGAGAATQTIYNLSIGCDLGVPETACLDDIDIFYSVYRTTGCPVGWSTQSLAPYYRKIVTFVGSNPPRPVISYVRDGRVEELGQSVSFIEHVPTMIANTSLKLCNRYDASVELERPCLGNEYAVRFSSDKNLPKSECNFNKCVIANGTCYDTNNALSISNISGNTYKLDFSANIGLQDAYNYIKTVKSEIDACAVVNGRDAQYNYIRGYTGACLSDVSVPILRFYISSAHTYIFDDANFSIIFDNITIPYDYTISGDCCMDSQVGSFAPLLDSDDILDVPNIQSILGLQNDLDVRVGGQSIPVGIPASGIDTSVVRYQVDWFNCAMIDRTAYVIRDYNLDTVYVHDESGNSLVNIELSSQKIRVDRVSVLTDCEGLPMGCNIDWNIGWNLENYGGLSNYVAVDGDDLANYITSITSTIYDIAWSEENCVLYNNNNISLQICVQQNCN